jgi:hypothetical protein
MEFLGGVFIFIALLMIPTAIVGLISPARLAKKGATPASRTKILGSCLACFLACIILGGAIVPNKRSQQAHMPVNLSTESSANAPPKE